MPRLIEGATRVEAAGNKPKLIDEYVGRVNTGDAAVSVAHMRSPGGWVEPGQRPEFREVTVVLRGALDVEHEGGRMTVAAGQAVVCEPGEWVRYSTPGDDGAEYIAVCLPAFAPGTVHRDEGVSMERVDVILEGAAEAHEALGERLAAVAEALLVAEGLEDRELSLVLTDDENIRELNSEWRGEDKPTDVLSFPMDEGEEVVGPEEGLAPLGDIVISVETAAIEAGKTELDLDGMAVFLLVHGFCHLLGHDHGEPEEAAAMREAEDRLLAAVAPGLKRPPTPY